MIFKTFKDDMTPLDLLIRDDITIAEFSKAIEKYNRKKEKVRKDGEELEDSLKADFVSIIKKYCEVKEKKQLQEKKLIEKDEEVKETQKEISEEKEREVIEDMSKKLKIDIGKEKLTKDYWRGKISVQELADKVKKSDAIDSQEIESKLGKYSKLLAPYMTTKNLQEYDVKSSEQLGKFKESNEQRLFQVAYLALILNDFVILKIFFFLMFLVDSSQYSL